MVCPVEGSKVQAQGVEVSVFDGVTQLACLEINKSDLKNESKVALDQVYFMIEK
mgnify:CR=1 FL=1